MKHGENFVKIVRENRGNGACTVGEIAIVAWQHCIVSQLGSRFAFAVENGHCDGIAAKFCSLCRVLEELLMVLSGEDEDRAFRAKHDQELLSLFFYENN